MPAPENQFKSAIKAGKPQFGCWIGLADAHAAEISATAGFDWLVIDAEHAPNNLRSVLAQLRIIESSASQAVVRPPIGESWIIKQYLDAGVQNLIIPMVESRHQAEDLVKAVQYPPRGIRGVGSALARASKFAGIADYLTTADEQICLLAQVESRAGINALDDILASDIDGVFLGPSDLAADMGFIGRAGAPEVKRTITDAVQRIVGAGKAAGILTLDRELQQTCLGLGARIIATGIDVSLFAAAMREAAQASGELTDYAKDFTK